MLLYIYKKVRRIIRKLDIFVNQLASQSRSSRNTRIRGRYLIGPDDLAFLSLMCNFFKQTNIKKKLSVIHIYALKNKKNKTIIRTGKIYSCIKVYILYILFELSSGITDDALNGWSQTTYSGQQKSKIFGNPRLLYTSSFRRGRQELKALFKRIAAKNEVSARK